MEGVIDGDKTLLSLALYSQRRARENHVLSPSLALSMLPHATERPESGITDQYKKKDHHRCSHNYDLLLKRDTR